MKKFFGMFNFGRDESIWPSDVEPEINSRLDGYLCKVVDIDCSWPIFRTKTQLNRALKDLTASLSITLESLSSPGTQFQIRYFPVEDYKFLIFHKYYEHKLELFKKVNQYSQIIYQNQHYNLEDKDANKNKSLFRCIKARRVEDDDTSGMQHRTRMNNLTQTSEQCVLLSPWEVEYTSSRKSRQRNVDSTSISLGQMLPQIPSETREKIRQRLIEIFSMLDYFFYFLAEVNKRDYPDYQKRVPLEMNIERIINRVIGNFYRQVDAIKGDIMLIAKNSEKFNGKNNEITIKADQIFSVLAEHI